MGGALVEVMSYGLFGGRPRHEGDTGTRRGIRERRRASMAEASATTDCGIAGAGPAGMILGLLLARRGVRVKVLESRGDFERDFRGDTIHPAVLELLGRIGLAEELLALRHGKLRTMRLVTPA